METCPVCKAEAEQFERGFIDGYAVKCPTHGWFEFSDTTRATRGNEPREVWERALTKARQRALQTAQHETVAGKRPRILDSDF
jgi:hypothetical protein